MPSGEEPAPRGASHSDRFACCVTLEDIGVSLASSSTSPSCVETSCWDEMRVVFTRNGVTQRTRWLSPVLAMRHSRSQDDNKSGLEAEASSVTPGVTKAHWSPINAAAFTVHFKQMDKEIDHSLDPGYERPVYSHNLKYLDSYNMDNVDRNRVKVCRKTIHPFLFSVECRNFRKKASSTGAEGGDRHPTSASVEAVSAYYARGASMVSTIMKKAAVKLGTVSADGFNKHAKGQEPHQNAHKGANHSSSSSSSINNNSGKAPSALYVCDGHGVDPSEAYNAPGGRQRISLQLYPASCEQPETEAGVPLVLHLTIVAHFTEPALPALRDFHSMSVLLDQVVLDVTNAQQGPTPTNATVSRKAEAYGFGFTSNISYSKELRCRSPLVAPPPIREGEEGGLRLIDFTSLHPSQNERELTASDFEKNPTSACIVSSMCKIANPKRIGNRVVLVSRFKTSHDGLCKPSYKCQLVMALLRRYNTGEVEEERCEYPVDLASILNQEFYPDKVRHMVFSQGEYMSFRLRRRCFAEPERYRSELLMPYDYDNRGVEISGLGEGKGAALLALGAASKADLRDATERGTEKSDGGSAVVAQEQGEGKVPTPRLTDNVLTSYNNYENHSYQPPLKPDSQADVDTEARMPQPETHKEAVRTPHGRETSDLSMTQKEESNPFEAAADASKVSLVFKSMGSKDVNTGSEPTNPFGNIASQSAFDDRVSNKQKVANSLPVVSFAPSVVEEDANDVVALSSQMGMYTFGSENTRKLE
ncbi:hypothetical protein DQ04_00321050 [Trypanosoma grayi]|uniref:hypothetical protein n=1 Tax=Trypanosoma grayi TaxID=71804 RepID=UPI0004F40642|nr:hypothetical protein DQ04_00321050 [Trypanosoma grayi]KEG14736.1 hypothetical protein DQ04_00321050 [Trypanosoma grayi]